MNRFIGILRLSRPRTLVVLGMAAVAVACGGDDAPTTPAADDPESLTLEVPAEITEGEDFSIEVTVHGEDGTRPLASFSGAVQLSASSGTLGPSTVQVSNGRGSTTATVTGSSGAVTVEARLGALRASSVVDVIPAFRTLQGDPDEPAAGAIPDSTYTFDPADYSDGHPDLPGLQTSFRVVLLTFELGTTVADANRILAPHEPELVGGVRGVPGEAVGIAVLRLNTSSHEDMEAALDELRDEAAVGQVVQDVLLEGLEPVSDGSGVSPVISKDGDAAGGWTWDLQPSGGNWGLELMRVPQMWNTYPPLLETVFDDVGSELPRTGVWDVGFMPHPDLTNLISISQETFDFGAIDHGVHVAGTIGATFNNGIGIDGVNPLAKMHGLVATGPWIQIFQLLESTPDLAVLNMSLGFNWKDKPNPKNPNTDEGIQATVSTHGILVQAFLAGRRNAGKPTPLIFSAAGNDSGATLGDVEAKWSSPFNYAALQLGESGIVIVEAVGQSGAAPGGASRATFSNRGGHVSAPGVGILSSFASTDYAAIQGTSMATPHVTGLAGYLLTIEPSLSQAQVVELLTSNAAAVGGGAVPRVDAFASVMDIDRLTGSPHVLRMITDTDDGTEDGNRRTDPDAGDATFEDIDADGNGALGDGKVDMADFRRWRDAYLTIVQPAGLDLDGGPDHPKKDANGNGKTFEEGDDESIHPFADLNGNGSVNATLPAFVPGRFGKEVTDLEMLEELFEDPHHESADLEDLLLSADVAVRPAALLEADDVVDIRSSIRPQGTDEPEGGPRFNRVHTGEPSAGEGLWQVYTVPESDEGYTVRVVALDAAGDTLQDLEKDFPAKPGQDSFWDPEEEAFEYTEAFDTTAGPEWSRRTIAVAPNGERFLGLLNDGTLSLTLEELPAHEEIEIAFDLHILQSMDGNGDPDQDVTPDPFTFLLDGEELMRTSFSNVGHDDDDEPAIPQAWPGTYPTDSHPRGTGASAIEALGYPPSSDRWWGDTTYRIAFTVPHSAVAAVLSIVTTQQTSWPNEGWGIDNVRVTTMKAGES